jgi:hypothetical protein
MNKIDKAFNKFSNFRGYTGNPPTNENEYNELLNDSSRYFQGNPVFEGTAPSWSEIQNKVSELEQEEQAKIDAKASALAKLSALGLTEEEVQAIIK